MTTIAAKRATPQNYVQQLRLGSPMSSKAYLHILNDFQHFLAEQIDRKSVSQDIVRQWLSDRIRVWSLHTVSDRARLIDRFLDWMVDRGALPDNPFAALRKKYGQRTTKPIVQALLNPAFEVALEALRRTPRFGSFLGPVMRDYVALMQAMGYCYNTEETRLLLLDRFLQGRPDLSGQPLPMLIREWTNTGSTPQHALVCHVTGRVLSRALSRVDPTTEKLPWDQRIFQQAQSRYRRPYIFSDQEFLRLSEAALRLPSPQSPLRPQTLHMMLVLAYCAGLRIGEILRLNVGDFDGDDRTIEIRRTKFFKSRRLPLTDSVAAALQHISTLANRPVHRLRLTRHFSGIGRRPGDIRAEWPKVYCAASYGARNSNPLLDARGPAGHDLRHAFVVNRMLAWYREGVNPQPHLPYLATYLGHKDINSTLVYLTITQELLQQASERFRVRGAQILRGSTEGGNA